jgi:ABC-type dipeptide/oligopeptide/nickel transport system permease subunit
MATAASSTATVSTTTPTKQVNAWQRFRRNKLGLAGAVIVLLLIVMAITAPWLAPSDPAEQSLLNRRQPPNATYLLGTDEFGRDILSRLLYGARYTLLISVSSVAIGLVIGGSLGFIAGYVGGLTSGIIMRLMDLLLAFPYLLLAIMIVSALGPGVRNTIVAIGIWTVPAFARVARGAVSSVRERDFVQAAKALGTKQPRILWRHVLPNALATLLVYASLYLAYAILMESALSFLGLGVQPPTPSWAVMISSGRNYITNAPHIATIPGIAIAVAVLGFNLLGDALRDALDPRSLPS